MRTFLIVILAAIMLTGCTTTGGPNGIGPVEAFDRLAVLHADSDYESVKLVFGLEQAKPLAVEGGDNQKVEWYELSHRFAILLIYGLDAENTKRLQLVSFATLDGKKPHIILQPKWEVGRGMATPPKP